MLRLIQIGNSLATSYPVSSVGDFMPGMVGQLALEGNNIVCGVSDGTAPLGVIDNTRTKSFYSQAVDEEVIAPTTGIRQGNKYVSVMDVQATLDNPNVLERSFISRDVKVLLNPRNGVVVFPAGTELNVDLDGDGIPDAIRTVVAYTYQVPNVPGDDDTMGSNRISIWFQRMICATDQYEASQRYPLNAPLFVSEAGYFTTRQPSENHPTIAIVTGPPNPRNNYLELLWL